MLPEFNLLIPESLSEALKLSEEHPEASYVAGGTNMVVDLRSGRREPKLLMNIGGLKELSEIKLENGYVFAGSAVTISELYHNPTILEHAHCLDQAAAVFANPLVSNRATIGGNLADASPAADTATPLLALGAEVEVVSWNVKRYVPLDEFFLDVRKTVLKPGELMSAIRWPIPPLKSANFFYKLGLRKADAISIVSVAVFLAYGPQDEVSQVRIALGSVAPTPLRARAAEEAIMGKCLSDSLIDNAAKLAAEATSPISDVRASAAYRKQMSEVLVARLIRQAAAEISGQG